MAYGDDVGSEVQDLLRRAQENPLQAQGALSRAMELVKGRRVVADCEPQGGYTPPYTTHLPGEQGGRRVDQAVRAGSGVVLPMTFPSRYLTVAGITALAPQATVAARLEFGGGAGWLIGMRGIAVDLTAGVFACGPLEQATYEVQISFNDREPLITNGNNAAFINYQEVFGSLAGAEWAPFMRYVKQNDVLQFIFRNRQPAGGNTLTGSLSFAFWPAPNQSGG